MSEPEKRVSRQRENQKGNLGAMVGLSLPWSEEAEAGILSCMTIDPERVLPIIDSLGVCPDWFHKHGHRVIFEGMRTLENEGKPVDYVSVKQWLKDKGELETIGGESFVTGIFEFCPTAANVRYYVGVVAGKHFRRSGIRALSDLQARLYDETEEIQNLRAETETALLSIAESKAPGKRQRGIKEAVFAVVERVNKGKSEDSWGLSTGYPNLDAVARGLRVSNMIAIGGETSAGKTSLALNIVANICIKRKIPTLVFSLEMTTEEVTEVLIQIRSGINVDAATEGRINPQEANAFTTAAADIAQSPLTIFDDPDMSIIEARSIARRVKPRLIVLDYAQLMSGGKKKYERNELEIADIAREAKKMAGELEATVILLTQLNDDGKIAGSRAIGKHANSYWVIADTDDKGEKEVRISKNRRGAKDSIYFRWIGACQKLLPKALT